MTSFTETSYVNSFKKSDTLIHFVKHKITSSKLVLVSYKTHPTKTALNKLSKYEIPFIHFNLDSSRLEDNDLWTHLNSVFKVSALPNNFTEDKNLLIFCSGKRYDCIASYILECRFSNYQFGDEFDESEENNDGVQKSFGKLQLSETAARMFNPIRTIVDKMKLVPKEGLEMIRLSIGDPTVFGNYPIHENVRNSVVNAVKSGKYDGYGPAHGIPQARQAIADITPGNSTKDDVYITNGASGALEILFMSLCEGGNSSTIPPKKGKKILIPRPGFALYKTICGVYGIPYDFYNCLADKNWEVDLDDLRSKICDETAAILICNPSNPTGACFSRKHLKDIVKICEEAGIAIIADEIYANMTFSGKKFTYCHEVSEKVPVFSVGGIAKRYVAPGWRLGWFVIHNRSNRVTNEMRGQLVSMCQRILGPCGPVQGALPDILLKTPASYYTDLNAKLEEAGKTFATELKGVKGLTPIMPDGAMYLMVTVDMKRFKKSGIKNDMEFCERMIWEQSVFCLPGSAFDFPDS